MNTSMYEQMSDEVSKCLMLNGICLVYSEHKIKERLSFTGNFYLVFYLFELKSNTNSNAYSKTIPKSNANPNPNLNPNLNP